MSDQQQFETERVTKLGETGTAGGRQFYASADYSSWTDNDLVRAIDADPDCRDEYINELANRRSMRAVMASKTEALAAEIEAKLRGYSNGE